MYGRYTSLHATVAVLGIVLTPLMPNPSLADEGGASMYLPGAFGSLAAVPGAPGWSLASVYYHGKGSFDVPGVGRVSETSDLGYGVLAYAFDQPVLGGQLALSMTAALGRIQGSITGVAEDSRFGYNDLLPAATMRWGAGVHNYMVYGLGSIPVGSYNSRRLANFGIGHGGIDGGAGYTYFDTKAGYEFTIAAGATYNLRNTTTDYQNGIDGHIDLGASKFLSTNLHLGLVGYYYQQLTSDKGQPPTLGDFKSRVAGIGPQIGYFFPIGDAQAYVNLKGYQEFAAENRPAGWNAWLSLVISAKTPPAPAPSVWHPPLGH